MQPYWGLAVIDGHEGMEGNGPVMGTPVASKLAIASTDFIAADRVAVECMGVDPNWVGYLRYCAQVRARQLRHGEDRHPRSADCLGAEEVPDECRCRTAVGLDDAAGRGGRFLERSERPANRQAAHSSPAKIVWHNLQFVRMQGRSCSAIWCPRSQECPALRPFGDVRTVRSRR